jgi:SAM-dependent methyltransferase
MVTVSTPEIAPGNQNQLTAWDGEEGGYWAEHADRFDRGVARYQQPLLDAAAIQPTDRVLDIGCGSGRTSLDAAHRAPSGTVLGVDLSAAMLEVARRTATAEGLANVRFAQVDAQVHPFEPGSFDVAVSRTGGMFFADPLAAYANIVRALRPGGRLALLVWQPLAANEWIREIGGSLAAGRPVPLPPPEAPGPFAFGDPDRARGILTGAGFEGIEVDGLAEPMWFGRDPDDAMGFILGLMSWMLEGLDAEGRERAMADLRRTLEQHTGADGVEFGSATWLITARRPG